MKTRVSRILVASLALCAWAGSTSAQTISNPSFEANPTFTVNPGYVSGNAPITDWAAGDANRAGLNPGTTFSPFADNGFVPAGSRVAFIQNGVSSSLSSVISGLTPAVTYKVNFRVNARTGNTPNLKVDIDANNIINTAVTPVGGGNPYKNFAFDFTATAASHTMKLRNDSGGDTTVLVDDFSIAVSTSGWSYTSWTDDASSGVDPLGNYTHAYSFGSGVNATINGIVFEGVGGGNPFAAPLFSTTGLNAAFTAGDANNVTGVGGSRQLANDFVYNGFPATITINALTVGAEYEATIYSVGWENGTRAATFSVGDDRLTVNQDHYGDNNGIRVKYHYIATSSSITLTYAPLQAASFHTYGFSNNQLSGPPTRPFFVIQPQGRCVSEGQPLTLTGKAFGQPGPTYQWQKDAVDIGSATSPSYVIASALPADSGDYTLIAINGVTPNDRSTSVVAVVEVGLPMTNPSFEVDTFTVYPFYVSGNTPITGWSSLGNHGINTAAGPFADNGRIPDRNQVAFMQGNGALSQMVSGFAIGDSYYIDYYENSRQGDQATDPSVEVQVGGVTLVAAHQVPVVGGANAYRRVTSPGFIASATTLEIAFIKSDPFGTDNSVLIDNVCVVRIPPNTPPTIISQPQGVVAAEGDTVTFTVVAAGALPLSYDWRKGGVSLGAANSATLTLLSVFASDSGKYSVKVSNVAGDATSDDAALCVLYRHVPGIFGTGLVDLDGTLAADGTVDEHYSMTSSADPGFPGTDARVVNQASPIAPAGPWVANGPASRWIAPQADETVGNAPGDYTFTTSFNLTGYDHTQFKLVGGWATDNTGVDILINGASTGITIPVIDRFGSLTPFTIASGFNATVNTLEFKMNNAGTAANPTGLRVDLKGFENIPPELTITLTGGDVSVAWSPINPCQILQSAQFVTGPWTEVVNAPNPYMQSASGPAKFFRVFAQ